MRMQQAAKADPDRHQHRQFSKSAGQAGIAAAEQVSLPKDQESRSQDQTLPASLQQHASKGSTATPMSASNFSKDSGNTSAAALAPQLDEGCSLHETGVASRSGLEAELDAGFAQSPKARACTNPAKDALHGHAHGRGSEQRSRLLSEGWAEQQSRAHPGKGPEACTPCAPVACGRETDADAMLSLCQHADGLKCLRLPAILQSSLQNANHDSMARVSNVSPSAVPTMDLGPPHHSSTATSGPEYPERLSIGSLPQANAKLPQPRGASQPGAEEGAAAALIRTEIDRAALVQEHGDVLKRLLANLASRKKLVKAVLHMLHVR